MGSTGTVEEKWTVYSIKATYMDCPMKGKKEQINSSTTAKFRKTVHTRGQIDSTRDLTTK